MTQPLTPPFEDISLLWLKFNDSFGFVGCSGGQSIADLDRNISTSQAEILLGEGIHDRILLADKSGNEQDIDCIMESCGWQPDDALFRSNGTVYAHAYRRVGQHENAS